MVVLQTGSPKMPRPYFAGAFCLSPCADVEPAMATYDVVTGPASTAGQAAVTTRLPYSDIPGVRSHWH